MSQAQHETTDNAVNFFGDLLDGLCTACGCVEHGGGCIDEGGRIKPDFARQSLFAVPGLMPDTQDGQNR